jgi:hypothetical protein
MNYGVETCLNAFMPLHLFCFILFACACLILAARKENRKICFEINKREKLHPSTLSGRLPLGPAPQPLPLSPALPLGPRPSSPAQRAPTPALLPAPVDARAPQWDPPSSPTSRPKRTGQPPPPRLPHPHAPRRSPRPINRPQPRRHAPLCNPSRHSEPRETLASADSPKPRALSPFELAAVALIAPLPLSRR